MALHGKARDRYIDAIKNRKAFREGAAITGIEGKHYGTGRMPSDWAGRYVFDDIVYTVLSYGTPIGWVTTSGDVVIPDVKYSVTTSGHQSLINVYL